MTFFHANDEIEAHQWFKNGDHPKDECILIESTNSPGSNFLSEGKVVRYYRHPSGNGSTHCPHCGIIMHEHGWIDQGPRGRVVCPGDYIITEPQTKQYYPIKQTIFNVLFEALPESKNS